jgi:hypothetical protein
LLAATFQLTNTFDYKNSRTSSWRPVLPELAVLLALSMKVLLMERLGSLTMVSLKPRICSLIGVLGV